ncbi:hypothetical protein QVD17_10605 [Tagetes erecta]|uniref:Uncharacterized protein n=1 Tax=Tagetes erecta TaxID=13708 RepID=A0AAD8L9L5_TARER|nr:hypothetical protein QVD17_10605 [Tagetes erecta]
MSFHSLTFPILPPPQLQSWNIPAPVIYPPGSDPPSFINPNSNCHRVSATMDVDPCVIGLRDGGIVAKVVDLTASEHSGVLLSKATTMVPPTSTSSDSVAPRTVKDDMIVTTIESKNTNFKEHMVGKIHVMNIQNPIINHETPLHVANGVLDQEFEKKNKNHNLDITQKVIVSTASSVTNDILDQETQEKNKNQDLDISQQLIVSTPSSVAIETLDQKLEKKNQDSWQNEETCESLFVCGIPEPGVDYPKIAIVEVDESLFKIGVSNPKSVSRTKVQVSEPTFQPVWCDNIAGKQHQNNLKVSEKPLTPQRTTLVTSMDTTSVTKPMEKLKSIKNKIGGMTTWCEICKIHCHNKVFDIHESGKRHKKNLEKLENLRNLPLTVIDAVTTPPAEQLKSTKGEVVNPNEHNSARCELCDVSCSSPDILNQHISGKKHQRNLMKSGKQRVRLPEPMNEEGEVVLFEKSKRKVGDLLKCDKDADAKRQKMNEEGEVVLSERSKRKAGDSLKSDVDAADTKRRQKMDEEEEGCGVLVKCKVCNLDCNGLMAFKTHVESFEHLKMALKHANGGSNGLQV